MFARSSRAKGRCDGCGFTRLLSSLREEVVDGRKTGARKCAECFDPDHPLHKRGRKIFDDPQNLRDPRPDADRIASTSLFGWAPIGNQRTCLTMGQGTLNITVSED